LASDPEWFSGFAFRDVAVKADIIEQAIVEFGQIQALPTALSPLTQMSDEPPGSATEMRQYLRWFGSLAAAIQALMMIDDVCHWVLSRLRVFVLLSQYLLVFAACPQSMLSLPCPNSSHEVGIDHAPPPTIAERAESIRGGSPS
jgi:hypothetical protein